jgi:hypothetical protein
MSAKSIANYLPVDPLSGNQQLAISWPVKFKVAVFNAWSIAIIIIQYGIILPADK